MTVELRPEITVDLVRRLVAAQFPEYADFDVTKVEPGGNDNRTFRLGDRLLARLPSATGYVASVEKEHRHLPALAAQLPVPIPAPVGFGTPGEGYPFPWSIYRWLDGVDAITAPGIDRPQLARDLAAFIRSLQAVDATDGPIAGAHSFWRGGSLMHYDAETRATTAFDRNAERVWDAALASSWQHPPVWFHGDIAPGNILISEGRLSGMIDFGTSGVGDPACDLVIAWTYFDSDERELFAAEVGLDNDTWARAKGWALWKALITDDERVIGEVLA
jgi:aminoglycoside phosphotransferase (APT) family kinase protein